MNSSFVDNEYMYSNLIFAEYNQAVDLFSSQKLSHSHELINLDTFSHEQNESKCTSSNLEVPDFPDDCLKFISDFLLGENVDENLACAQELSGLQATEKSFYDALGESYTYPYIHGYPHSTQYFSSSSNNENQPQLEAIVNEDDFVRSFLELHRQSSSSNIVDIDDGGVRELVASMNPSPTSSRNEVNLINGKKSRQRDDVDYSDGKSRRGNKLQATSSEDYVEMVLYDDVLFSGDYKVDAFVSPSECAVDETCAKSLKKGGDQCRRGKEKMQTITIHDDDLWSLLIECAQAVSSFNLRASNELLKQIRQHSTPYGDSLQRLGHHVANGLEARLAGTGSTFSASLSDMKISSSDFLKYYYKLYAPVIPFKSMSYFLANNTIYKLSENATKIHIIDFGIFLGLQWPSLIQTLSKRPNGRPKLRITGVDFPQQGFQPTERINATGRRLADYCDRFDVPFEYQGIAKKWETIQPQDLKIESDEIVVVNCMFGSGTLLDETIDSNSPRDAFLGLVRKLNPNLFVHGIVNGTFTSPFFNIRFKEALHHYSLVFEVLDANLPREAHERLLIESEIYGHELINLVACEGAERIQRPERYTQWQERTVRSGLRQMPLQQEFMTKTKAMVKANYHQEFLVDENRHWMLQGWRGRIFCALSFWQTM